MDRRQFILSSLATSLAVQSSASGRVLASEQRRLGVNLIEDTNAPFGSDQARESLRQIKMAGIQSVAIVPFFWQSHGADPQLVFGSALPLSRLKQGISDLRELGLRVLVKPHVWVPDRWAGSVLMQSRSDWDYWFENYRKALVEVAQAAEDEGANALCVGTELRETTYQDNWFDVIEAARSAFTGELTYVAHNSQEALRVPFWDQLNFVSASLYPELGRADSQADWRAAMRLQLDRCTRLAKRHRKPFCIGEIGLRSATDATSKPWESAEERAAEADPQLQYDVLSEWLQLAEAYQVNETLIWRWISDPNAGGTKDTDFTIQNKPAQKLFNEMQTAR
ncbi:MAG: hypothetical protein ABJP70_06595 [Erythrobacter sp.]